MASSKKINFGSLASDLVAPQPQPAAQSVETYTLTSFKLNDTLRVMIERVAYWEGGRGGTKKEVINEAIRRYLIDNPNAHRPTPDEQK